MDKTKIIRFDPRLLGAVKKALGALPAIPGDLAKIKTLTFFNDNMFPGEPGQRLMGWIELCPGDFSAIGKMPNLHTLLFRNAHALKIGDFSFLVQCQKLKKLDLSGTDFADCALFADMPSLRYALLPDRRQLINTKVLKELEWQAESEQEMNERSRAESYMARQKMANSTLCGNAIVINKNCTQVVMGHYVADSKLVRWIVASLGKMPNSPGDLAKIRQLDSRKVIPSSEVLTAKWPAWLTEKEGDFSLIGHLPNLQALFLWGMVLEDFSFLSQCKELLYLNLWDTNFTDCRLLAKLPSLRYVCLPKRGELKYLEVLEEVRNAGLREARSQLEHALYDSEAISMEQAQSIHKAEALYITYEEGGPDKLCQSVGSEALYHPTETTGQKPSADRKELCQHPNQESRVVSRQVPETKTEEVVYQEDMFKDLVTVRGEDVTISYEGSFKVRHVRAEFCWDEVPPLWEIFDKVSEEEDNWAKLGSKKAEQLIEELTDAIVRQNVNTLYFSLEPWGEGHMFIFEFADGWVDITYMDDETPVYYNSYNPDYENPAELSPIEFEGQTPIPKMLALEDMDLVAKIARHVLETGQLLPGTLWKTGGVL